MKTNIKRIPSINSPWHEGERQLQASVGMIDRMEEVGKKVVRQYMPDQHREFYEQLPFIMAGVVDAENQPWATILTQKPGFVTSPNKNALDIKATLLAGDPAEAGLKEGNGIGFLGIELHTRRRNRVNGTISSLSANGLSVAVDQTMGNCPKYIQHRNYKFARDPGELFEVEPLESSTLSEQDVAAVQSTDSFYVASYMQNDSRKQVDVSHRGGKPGFVKVDENGELTIPDFAGNTFFNTLGNILLTGKAGLIFIDYDTGDVLQMTGTASVVLDASEIDAFGGAERLWTFNPSKVVRRNGALPLRWDFEELSPYVMDKGSWEKVDRTLKNKARQSDWEPMRVVSIVDESSVIRSFYLEPADGSALMSYKPGQHLPIRVTPDTDASPVIRTYTLSSAPSDLSYRISVKREGLVSTFLHDQISVGDIIDTREPQGSFTLNSDIARPAVLMAGGVGITPMISMAREVVANGLLQGQMRPVWLFQASRSPEERAFDREFGDLIAKSNGMVRRVRAETEEAGGFVGDSFHPGRIDIDLLKSTLPFDNHEFYLCGPARFMQAMYDALRGVGVEDDRIFAESFGPASLKRTEQTDDALPPLTDIAKSSVAVTFSRSNSDATWNPELGDTLLELAEANGLEPEFSCRGGNCGTCRTPIVAGNVTYTARPEFDVGDDEALICCAFPADDGDDSLELDL